MFLIEVQNLQQSLDFSVLDVSRSRFELVQAFESEREKILPLLDIRVYTRDERDLKKKLLIISNIFEGLHNGLSSEDREITLKIVRSNLASVKSILKDVSTLIEKLEKTNTVKQKVKEDMDSEIDENSVSSELDDIDPRFRDFVSLNDDFQVSLEFLRTASSKLKPVKPEKSSKGQASAAKFNLKEDINKLKQDREKIRVEDEKGRAILEELHQEVSYPISVKNQYVVLKSNIVPLFENPISMSDKLHASGIQFERLQQYYILKAQYLLGIDKKIYEKNIGAKKTNKKLTIKSIGQYAEDILKVLNESLTTEFSIVTHIYVANPRNANIVFFWILPTGKLSSLLRLRLGKIKNWALY